MGRKFIILIIFLLFISVTFLIILIRQSWFGQITLLSVVDPIAISNILITIILTVIVGWYITKKITEQRFEKDFLIEDLKQVEREIHIIEDYIDNTVHIDPSFVASRIGNIHLIKRRCHTISKEINLAYINIEQLNDPIDDLYDIATDLQYSDRQEWIVDIPGIKRSSNILIQEVRKLIIKINKC